MQETRDEDADLRDPYSWSTHTHNYNAAAHLADLKLFRWGAIVAKDGETDEASPVSVAPTDNQLVTAEYVSLRNEILKLMELQSQLVALAVVSFGTIISVGYQVRNGAIIATYPLIALVLGTYWLNHSHAIARCSEYIRMRLEAKFPGGSGWESYVQSRPVDIGAFGSWVGVRGIFLISSPVSLVAAVSVMKSGIAEWFAFSMGCTATLVTVAVFLVRHEPSEFRDSRRSLQKKVN